MQPWPGGAPRLFCAIRSLGLTGRSLGPMARPRPELSLCPAQCPECGGEILGRSYADPEGKFADMPNADPEGKYADTPTRRTHAHGWNGPSVYRFRDAVCRPLKRFPHSIQAQIGQKYHRSLKWCSTRSSSSEGALAFFLGLTWLAGLDILTQCPVPHRPAFQESALSRFLAVVIFNTFTFGCEVSQGSLSCSSLASRVRARSPFAIVYPAVSSGARSPYCKENTIRQDVELR